MALPPDPFLPEDPRVQGMPMAKYMLEAMQLSKAFIDVASLSSLVERLNAADRRDVMLALATEIHDALKTVSDAEGLTNEEASARWLNWLVGPPSLDSLDDL